ncbi:MAG: NAD-dependent epimerase/dehydratase family protein [Burkholderiaceae bacterium]
MNQSVLITGGFGFLGRAVARRFKREGWRVLGIGRGRWPAEEALARGFDVWLDAGVSLPSLMTLNERFDLVVHCAGNGSVGYSLTNPLQDFYKTVQGTADLLEYLRLTESSALLVYPSSAGVYGARPDAPIRETDPLEPISPYGVHKKITEELLASYSRSYGVRVAIVRFFSIYGRGLTKQLLWDASARLRAATDPPAVFWGTGEETRDWISSEDAAGLIGVVAQSDAHFCILNGASGERVTVRRTLELLNHALGGEAQFEFNGAVRPGDPRFYHADVSRAQALGWKPAIALEQGMANYVRWLRAHGSHLDD